jgi:dihydrolipoamide dehydrogenase
MRATLCFRLWSLGDVTGALFTHVANYRGRVVTGKALGRQRTASYDGTPRVVFIDPEITATGLTAAQAYRRGIDTAATKISLADTITRPWTYAASSRRPASDSDPLAEQVSRDRRIDLRL